MNRVAGILLVLFAGAASAYGMLYSSEEPLGVKVTRPEVGNIESSIRVTGRVVNDRIVIITTLIDGQIREMNVRKGDSVKAGQVLTVLDQREAEAMVDKRRAELERERQTLNESERRYKRLSALSKSGGASPQDIDDAETERKVAQARLKIAQAEVKLAEIHLDKATIIAPFAGVITEKTTDVGQWMEAGTKLFTLVAHQGREIEVNVDAGDSSVVKENQIVSVSSDAWPGTTWQERVLRISPAISDLDKTALNTFAVRISLGEKAPPLLLGQQVDARIRLNSREAVLKLPFNALISSAGNLSDVAVVRNGKIHIVKVQTGLENLSHIEIKEGLDANTQVVLPDGNKLTNDQPVVITPEDNNEH